MLKKNFVNWAYILLWTGCVVTSCSRKEDPCEVVQIRPLIDFHKAESHETLSSIAKSYSMTLDEICRLNGLESNSVLVPGQKIFIVPQRRFVSRSPNSSSSPIISVETNSSENSTAYQETESEKSETSTSQEEGEAEPPSESNLSYDEPQKPRRSFSLIWPIKGKVLRHFGDKLPNGSTSEGINISAPAATSVKACTDGTVMDAGELVLGFGKMILIKHKNGMISIYGHLQEIMVQRPQQGDQVLVQQGQVIGRVGKTGNVRTPQLHFQLRNSSKLPIDPIPHLPKE